MTSRAMIIVGAGASTRFGRDKLLAPVAGLPLVAHSVNTIRKVVDRCVLVHRKDQERRIASLRLGVYLAPGGATRTESERAGLAALGRDYDLVGIHDAARPLVTGELIDALFNAAEGQCGAIPVISPDGPILDRWTLQPLLGVGKAQTPQVFRAEALAEAFEAAAASGFEGHDTAEVVQRFVGCPIVAVPGDPANLKVTYPDDLEMVEALLEERVRSEPR